MKTPTKQTRTKILGIRLYPYQHKYLFELAKAKGTTPSRMIRSLISMDMQNKEAESPLTPNFKVH